MSRKVLLLTVGGSDEPLVSSIEHNKPDFIYFLCSADTKDPPRPGSYQTIEGPGKPCGKICICGACGAKTGKARFSIARQLNLAPDSYTIIKIPHFDNINDCYLEASRIIQDERARNPNTELYADYTGGTKSMTAGLAAAAMDDGNVTLCIISGKRLNLQKVEDGTQIARLIDNSPVMVEKKLQLLQKLWQGYHYQSCLSLLAKIYERPILDNNLFDRLEKIRFLCRAYEAWDRFDHSTAMTIFKREEDGISPKHLRFLGRIIRGKIKWAQLLTAVEKGTEVSPLFNARARLPGNQTAPHVTGENAWTTTPPEQLSAPGPRHSDHDRRFLTFDLVYDLILNARRRASQGRYDDAVARLYRALEMFGQLNLLRWNEPLYTDNLDTAKLPGFLQKEYETLRNPHTGKITLGLLQNYTLLSRLKTPAGKIFEAHKSTMLTHLQKRNNSLMAHGIIPVEKTAYREMLTFVEEFIGICCQELGEKNRLDTGLQFGEEVPGV